MKTAILMGGGHIQASWVKHKKTVLVFINEREKWGLTSTRHKLGHFGTNIWFNFISIIRLRVGVFSSGRKPEDPEKTHEVGQASVVQFRDVFEFIGYGR